MNSSQLAISRSEEEFFTPQPMTTLLFSRSLLTKGEKSESPLIMTKVSTWLISGDSDFSPLVSKLRENNKVVIGCGVKNSSSDLLIANCDEFIYYDDLVREEAAKKKKSKKTARKPSPGLTAKKGDRKTEEDKKQKAVDLIIETVEALIAERGEADKIWGSMVKQTLKRRNPGFNESYYGFRTFSQLLEDGQRRGLLELERDERSGGYIIRLPAHDD